MYLILSLGSQTLQNSRTTPLPTLWAPQTPECPVPRGLLIKDRLHGFPLQNFRIHHPLPHQKLPRIQGDANSPSPEPPKHPVRISRIRTRISVRKQPPHPPQLPSSHHLTCVPHHANSMRFTPKNMHCCLAEDLALHSAGCPVGDQCREESPQHCELQIQT